MSIPEYSLNVYQDFCISFPLNGKKILEIGGHLPRELVLTSGCKEWVSVSLDCPEVINSPDYSALNMDCRSLSFTDNQFDYIFSCTAFEHINNLDTGLDEMYRVLKPKGVLYSSFGPVWSSYCGHHLEFECNGTKADFNQEIIPSWSHLSFSMEETANFLFQKFRDAVLVKELLYKIYESDYINRLFYEDYIKLFLNSGFLIFQLNSFANRFDILTPELHRNLTEKFPGRKDFSSYGIRAVLLKL